TPDVLSAQQLARQGHCDQAVELFRKAVKTDRRDREARLGLADCLTTLGHADQALQAIEPGLDDNPTWRPRFLVASGRARMATHDLRNAGIDFTQARELAPHDPIIRRAVGDFYRERGTWALAVPEYRAALAIDSSDVAAQTGLAEALDYDRKSDEA